MAITEIHNKTLYRQMRQQLTPFDREFARWKGSIIEICFVKCHVYTFEKILSQYTVAQAITLAKA
ncbi:MAG: hypothetical protein KBH82_11415 [Syntrophorhabdaceae bacterium]|nr:hypothetical protein [Syntrophorhabdaceae bacterium]MDI9559796.1 hypothetical protein [Pseudomonadota bacterium]